MRFLLFFIFLIGCARQNQDINHWWENNGKLKILCTTAMIQDIVNEIGGEQVDTWTLIQGELDPHTYQMVKGDNEKLAFADIIFYNGVGLEHGPSLYHYLTTHPKAIPLGDKVFETIPSSLIFVKGQKDP